MLFSEPKIPQLDADFDEPIRVSKCFSALQRAENSSMRRRAGERRRAGAVSVLFSEPKIPQYGAGRTGSNRQRGFSALQRAENSSIAQYYHTRAKSSSVSVLFSEPKIPQWCIRVDVSLSPSVSVLFSEPKIPQ